MTTMPKAEAPDYQRRVMEELGNYLSVENVADLPPIYDYWSQRYVAPKLRALGFDSIDDIFRAPLARRCAEQPDRKVVAVSLGSGNAELEVRLAASLVAAGITNLEITCLELNPAMIERAAAAAKSAGVESVLTFHEADLNTWTAERAYDLVIASHSLHHVVELEHLLDQTRAALEPAGRFVINDMIGRNGHMRWPEALAILQLIWATTPDRYRYNHQLSRFEQLYENWDCSAVGFEGIRAQDILPLLLERFHPAEFLAFANVIGVFIDRGFGHNLNPEREDDRVFIDRVARLDELCIDVGVVKPTQMIASFDVEPAKPRFFKHWSPEFCVRDPERTFPEIVISVPGQASAVDSNQNGANESLPAIVGLRRVGRRVRRAAGKLRRAATVDRLFPSPSPSDTNPPASPPPGLPAGLKGRSQGDIGTLIASAEAFNAELLDAKHRLAPADQWYPYGSISNLWHLDRLLTAGNRDLQALTGGQPIADVGAADGDLAFFLARHGFVVDMIDWGPTNWNGLRGARLLAKHYDTSVTIHEVDLDSQFQLPRQHYGLVLFLGILYHLQNPLYVLRQLASHSQHLIVSTRVARVTADRGLRLERAPVAYLVDPLETNADATNWWIFSPAGLSRLVARAGWDVLEHMTVGRTRGDSDPSTPDRDERAFYLLRSRG
jgi:2-polyprenyl-3-methyl-5-hydroxy-6-metoxy-1,4-benzoquinol methylase